jgi:hypothetical protein
MTTDLRIGATEHRSGGVVQKSTFARFLAAFDFRLLQHYPPGSGLRADHGAGRFWAHFQTHALQSFSVPWPDPTNASAAILILTVENDDVISTEKLLFHQVHPAKLATDIGAAIVSLFFLWQHQLLIGLLTHFIPPLVGSAAVICFANLESYKNSRLGAYLVRYMTPTAQLARLAGDLVTVAAAWYQSLAGIAFGLAMIAAAWSYGLVLRQPR